LHQCLLQQLLLVVLRLLLCLQVQQGPAVRQHAFWYFYHPLYSQVMLYVHLHLLVVVVVM
jgi:hypothetical protein